MKKERTFVIGDIHGALKALNQVLEKAEITSSDKLIFLGDYVDGWSESVGVIDRLMELAQTHVCIFLKGNHDALLQEWLMHHQENQHWLDAGGAVTVAAYSQLPERKIEKHLKFLSSLEVKYVDDENRLFVHAGFSKTSGIENEYYPHVFYWDRTLWETALAADKNLKPGDLFYPKRFTFFKEMFIGHTPVTRVGSDIPMKALNLWNVDTGAAFKGKLTMMDIDTKTFFQSDSVYKLYPNEKGRNA